MVKMVVATFSWAILIGVLHSDEPNCEIRLNDVTTESRINFRYENGGIDKYYLVESMGAGLALFDADCDGLTDVYMVNGVALPGRSIDPPPSDRFYRNLGGMKFQEQTSSARLTDTNYGLGVTVGDFDNDGFADLYISNFGPKVLMRNNGDGTFSDFTTSAGVADGDKFGSGVTFLDIENDGDLDLFVGNYVNFDFARHDKLAPSSYPYPPGPRDFRSASDTLFRNNADGTFTDISNSSGIGSVSGPTMGVVAADFDQDGDVDIFAACDGEPNIFYQNDGQGNFTEEGLLVGVAYDAKGGVSGSMGSETADIDGDGRLDIAVTNYMDQLMALYRGSSASGFDDVASKMKLGKSVKPHVNWGVMLNDLDLDGDADAFICNGHFFKHAKSLEPITDYAVENCVMENINRQVFRDANAFVGSAILQKASSRGCAFDDLDNDGDIDGVVVNCDIVSQVLKNDTESNNAWLQLKLIGTRTNRSAVGVKVIVRTGITTQFFEQVNGRGYQSYYGSIVNIGLAGHRVVERIEITWPSEGRTQVFENVPSNQRLVFVEP